MYSSQRHCDRLVSRRATEEREALAYHVFSPRHQSLIDNLGGIVAPGIDMDAFLDDRV
jgi:hypothetical protein